MKTKESKIEAEEERLDEEDEEEVSLWSWGAGSEGQLATGTLEDQCVPQPLRSISSVHGISQMACGGAHAIALTTLGRALTWGRGTRGQLGHGDLTNHLKPKIVDFHECFVICHVSAGWNHSGFVTDTGRLFMCGDGSFGQLGNGDNKSYSFPHEVLFFLSKHVVQVACGMRHSLALVTESSGNSVYGYGSARHGQIGTRPSGHRRLINIPHLIPGFEDSRIVNVCANGDHSAALSANGQLYSWGRGFSGCSDSLQPQLLPSLLRFSQIALGWNHALLVSDGQVYMLGRMLTSVQQTSGEKLCPDMSVCDDASAAPASSLQRIICLVDESVVGIAAGAEHSAVVTDKGRIMTWGWGEHGQLGVGSTDDQISPQRVEIGWKGSDSNLLLRVYCGSGFTFVAKHG
ncbi:ultraviolet-B receptor UVR8 [Phalaenopsis equestris]|uniref:ultraviolet-B receptor UVR8 n=1 Tax=Phalaenopsis equestris TaxID=78828 RepID=UPI0009E1C790|nr:ultraviolet-B receptor UVR8 [Phalaenopsis equestris]